MAQFFGLDIPSGLEELFKKALMILSGEVDGLIALTQAKQSKARKRKTVARSLFVLWQSLYDGFTSTRRSAWQSYWGTLPFGDHGGSNQWPGSGYSAFVYVNAPRYKSGLDLLLDPPAISDELLTNPDFFGTSDPWELFHMDWSSGVVYNNEPLTTQVFLEQDGLDISPGYTYRCRFDFDTDNAGQQIKIRLGCYFGIADEEYYTTIDAGTGIVDIYVNFQSGALIPGFIQLQAAGSFSLIEFGNISLKRLP